jgi:UDP-N-acetylmuramyl pentapeptide synthase
VLALAAGLALGVSLEDGARGLAACRLTKGRLEQKRIHGIHVLDDSYNANPDSMRAALQTLASLPSHGARIAVLGRMGELGAEAERGHRSVGEAAVQHGISLLIVVGAEAKAIAEGARAAGLSAVHEVADPAAAAALLAGRIHPGDLLLLKGSRSARMERLLEHPPFQILSESLSPTETAHSASLV